MLRGVMEQLADLEPALAVALESERRPQRRTGRALGLQPVERHRLAVEFLELWFGIEGVHLRRPAVHEQVHHPLGLRREMRLGSGHRRRVAAQQTAQRQTAEAHPAALQEVAAVEDDVVGGESVVGHDA